jgi:DNA-binding Lrp family transcriptional regulator
MRYNDDLQEQVREMKEIQMLRYLCQEARASDRAVVNVGDAGEALGLPYEEAIRLADDLREDGFLQRVGRLNAPHGPGVRLTRAGIRASAG